MFRRHPTRPVLCGAGVGQFAVVFHSYLGERNVLKRPSSSVGVSKNGKELLRPSLVEMTYFSSKV